MKHSIFCFCFFLFVGVLFAKNAEVYPVKMSYNSIFTDSNGVKTQKVISDDGFEISVGAELNGTKLKYYVDMQNLTTKDFLLKRNCIQVYEGNYDTDKWNLLDINPSSLVITSGGLSMPDSQKNDDDTELSAEDACLIVGGTILCGLFLIDLCDDGDAGDYKIVDSKHSRFVDKPVRSYNHDSYPWISFWLFNGVSNTYDSSVVNQSKEMVLNSSNVTSDSYSAEFSVAVGSGPDYKLRVTLSENEFIDFYFMRTDRNNIVNPWEDRTFGRNGFLFSVALPYIDYIGAYYIYSGEPVGWYFGTAFGIKDSSVKTLGTAYNHNFDDVIMEIYAPYPVSYDSSLYYKYKFEKTGEVSEWSFNMTTGMTFKAFSHTWFMLGCGIDLYECNWYGNFYWKSSADNRNWSAWSLLDNGWINDDMLYPYCTPLVGVNMIFNWIDFAATFEYVIPKGPRFNAMLGFAF
ncbi:MAG: hypothetical protein K6A43_09880 [Treponema sp.]|nr:hypothetical protein [Treponema sp.]